MAFLSKVVNYLYLMDQRVSRKNDKSEWC